MRLYLFILISFTIEGEGVEVNVLVSPSFLTCGRRKGKGLVFFLIFFFIIEWLRRGVRV